MFAFIFDIAIIFAFSYGDEPENSTKKHTAFYSKYAYGPKYSKNMTFFPPRD